MPKSDFRCTIEFVENNILDIAMELEAMIKAVQKQLGVEIDGKPGPETWGAIFAEIVRPKIGGKPPGEALSKVDDRSEKNIATLLEEVRPIARALVQKADSAGIQIKIIGGTRTFAEQDALFAKGRTAPGPVVTNAKAGQSNHNFGIAFDIGVFSGSKYLGDSPKYKAVGALGIDLGLDWGGNWTSLKDEPHFQLRPVWARDLTESQMLAELRRRVRDDESAFG